MSDESEQPTLFEIPKDWEDSWRGMPAFTAQDVKPYDSISVQFRNEEDRRAFLALLDEHPDRRKSIWFPKMEYEKQSDRNAAPVQVESGAYPIYVISKGRWRYEQRLTNRALDKLGITHHLVVEPSELERYASVTTSHGLLTPLPFSDLGQGSIPARNWVWDHAVAAGASKHWILDDNMDGFYRLNENQKVKVVDFNPFIMVEVFSDRYTNIALSGMQYEFFADRRLAHPPYLLNTRVYSCILVNHLLPHRWRGRYNEDTDLSLRALKDGWCTVLFNAVLVKKLPTMKLSGGNTDELYKGDGRLKMAESLKDQHPDVVKVTQKWGRPQHHVNYKPFRKNQLIQRDAGAMHDVPETEGGTK